MRRHVWRRVWTVVLRSVFVALLGVIAFGLLSDGAPGMVNAVLQSGQNHGHDWMDYRKLPVPADIGAHFLIWLVAGIAGHIVLGGMLATPSVISPLFTLAAGSEFGQKYLAVARTPEVSDLAANGAGVFAGVLLAAGCARLLRRARLLQDTSRVTIVEKHISSLVPSAHRM